ncbi:GPW/gp25 family protein [Serratia plymuthica]|nr:GPW/gp25 family protein [Serratia plymuthica]UNK26352.1 GPW/gp25 family protein [Serratia plymuthica]
MMYQGMNTNSGRAVEDIDHIRQSISKILLTPIGSRITRRPFGSLMSELIDQPQNDTTRLQLMAAAYSAINRWEHQYFNSLRERIMSVIDLSQLPPPQVVETLSFENLLEERKARLLELYPDDQRAAIARTLELESEPIVMLLQENAYREVLLRQRINEAAQAVIRGRHRSQSLPTHKNA